MHCKTSPRCVLPSVWVLQQLAKFTKSTIQNQHLGLLNRLLLVVPHMQHYIHKSNQIDLVMDCKFDQFLVRGSTLSISFHKFQ
jgi:hypothetical protein